MSLPKWLSAKQLSFTLVVYFLLAKNYTFLHRDLL
jgi:hypothetical protein